MVAFQAGGLGRVFRKSGYRFCDQNTRKLDSPSAQWRGGKSPSAAKVEKLGRALWEFGEQVRLEGMA